MDERKYSDEALQARAKSLLESKRCGMLSYLDFTLTVSLFSKMPPKEVEERIRMYAEGDIPPED